MGAVVRAFGSFTNSLIFNLSDTQVFGQIAPASETPQNLHRNKVSISLTLANTSLNMSSLGWMPLLWSRWHVQPRSPSRQWYGTFPGYVRCRVLQYIGVGSYRIIHLLRQCRPLPRHLVYQPRHRYDTQSTVCSNGAWSNRPDWYSHRTFVRMSFSNHDLNTYFSSRSSFRDLRQFAKLASAIMILRFGGSPDWTWQLNTQMKNWTTNYIEWVVTSPIAYGEWTSEKWTTSTSPFTQDSDIYSISSNHATFFYNQLASLYIVVDNMQNATKAINQYFSQQYLSQIQASGEQVSLYSFFTVSTSHRCLALGSCTYASLSLSLLQSSLYDRKHSCPSYYEQLRTQSLFHRLMLKLVNFLALIHGISAHRQGLPYKLPPISSWQWHWILLMVTGQSGNVRF